MDRCKSPRRLYFNDMDEPSPATKPQFRPTRRCDSGELPSQEDCHKFREGRKRSYDDALKRHEAVVASTPNAVAKRHTVSRGVKSRASPLASRVRCSSTLSGRPRVEGSSQLAAGGSPRITRQQFQSSQLLVPKSTGVDEPLLCQAATKGRKRKRERAATSTNDVRFKALSRKSKTSLPEVPLTARPVHICRKNSEPQVPTSVDSKTRTPTFTDGVDNVKAQLARKKALLLEPQASKTFGRKRVFKEMAGEPIAAGLKREDVRSTKRTGRGPRQGACAGDGRVIDPRKVVFKASTSMLTNVTSRMAPSGLHRRCFEATTNSGWPQRPSDVPRTRDKTASATVVALGNNARRKRCVRKIDISSEAVDSSSSAAVQVSSGRDVVPSGGVGQFLVRALKFLFSSLLSRVLRLFTGALY
ncbi:hypothetical protein HPB50_024558 [Hyalomma asiaticum]|uniref:Uncharacterized protein n=1 Tax=Hyalomma asiaticum TaxID=266040 RepID=A0ACB7TN39_HYAAI|nr:hypothetical protein HPB50_024558 [Hyalomma asiaticum]